MIFRIILFLIIPYSLIGQVNDDKPVIISNPKHFPFQSIKYFPPPMFESKIADFMQKDTTLVYVIEQVERRSFIDLRVIGLSEQYLTDTSMIRKHLSLTNRFFDIDGKKIPVLPYIDKEFSDISWSYTGDVLVIRYCKWYQTTSFKEAIIEKYEKLTISDYCP